MRIPTLKRFLTSCRLLRTHEFACTKRTQPCYSMPMRYKSSQQGQIYTEEGLKSSYSHDQQQMILRVLNNASPVELRQYEITKTRALSLERRRLKKGNFNALEDVMEIESFGLKHIQNLCDSILYGLSEETEKVKSSAFQQLSYPRVSEELKKTIKSVVALHIVPQGIVWLHLGRDLDLFSWDRMELDDGARVYNHKTNLELTHKILQRLPMADVYIMDHKQLKMKQANVVQALLGLYQLESMLTALLNRDYSSADGHHRVFTIKDSLVGRYFDLKIGTEIVSSQDVVQRILSGAHYDNFGRIACAQEQIAWYDSQSATVREHLAGCLLQAIAFYKLEVIMRTVVT